MLRSMTPFLSVQKSTVRCLRKILQRPHVNLDTTVRDVAKKSLDCSPEHLNSSLNDHTTLNSGKLKSAYYIPEPDSPDYQEWVSSFAKTIKDVAKIIEKQSRK